MILRALHPAKLLVLGYLIYALAGWLLLLLPICHKQPVSILDDFFVAISAVSTTGLATIDIGTVYSFFGQLVLLFLVQLGGLGYMTISSFIILRTTGELTGIRKKLTASNFSLPNDVLMKEFLHHVIIFTFICEAIGAVALSLLFYHAGVVNPIWNGIFHSVSSFSTAGLSLFNDSFVSFQFAGWMNAILITLCVLGSIGFIVCYDFYKKWAGEKDHLFFTTKIILWATSAFLLVGSTLFFFLETPPPGATIFDRWIAALFQIVTATTTTGYNTLDIGSLSSSLLLLLLFCSLFGASPAGTGGGLKNTTFIALLGLVKSIVQMRKSIFFWKHEIPWKRVRIATASSIFYGFILFPILFLLTLFEKGPFLPIFFEAVSALNNLGLSMGLTSNLTFSGKILISLLMLIGRTGVLTFGIAISGKKSTEGLKQASDLAL